jgi:hypothetical protein
MVALRYIDAFTNIACRAAKRVVLLPYEVRASPDTILYCSRPHTRAPERADRRHGHRHPGVASRAVDVVHGRLRTREQRDVCSGPRLLCWF